MDRVGVHQDWIENHCHREKTHRDKECAGFGGHTAVALELGVMGLSQGPKGSISWPRDSNRQPSGCSHGFLLVTA